MATATEPTIDEALEEFLAAQRAHLAPKTFRNYEAIVDLLRSCLNGYGHQSLDRLEERRFTVAYEAGDEEAFCHLFGPEKIVENYSEFLGYFMIRKVMASTSLVKAAGTVTRTLADWLRERGYVDPELAAEGSEHAADASRDLPRALELGEILHDLAAAAPPIDFDRLEDDDFEEDSLEITRVEPGKLWFSGRGPIEVPERASELAQVGWSAWVVLARERDRWSLLEVGFVYP